MADRSYDDILHLPRPVSARHRPMAAADRAAQFAPFAALTGYNAVIRETARHTDARREPDETAFDTLNERLAFLIGHEAEHPAVTITCFLPDARKAGGAYRTLSGTLGEIDTAGRLFRFRDGRAIPFDDITAIDVDGDLLSENE